MANYTYATNTDAVNAVASRLYDPTFQQWTAAELLLYLQEALHTWNALSSFWRAEMAFPLVQFVNWYDLFDQVNTIVPLIVKQRDIITQIQYHLLEPVGDTWTGSLQFNLGDIRAACHRRQDDFIGESACRLQRLTPGAAQVRRTILSDQVIDIRRVAWIPTPGFGFSSKILRQSDAFAQRAFSAGWRQQPSDPPSTWLQNTQPPPSFDVDSIPPVPGSYDVVVVMSETAWTATSQDVVLPVPTDWAWVTKFGALADLFSRESNAKDAMRAEYCRRRFEEGCRLARLAPMALSATINDVPVGLDSLRNGDDFNARWQALTPGQPKSAYTAANLMAFAPAPAASGTYGVSVSVVRNAPIDATYVQVARDDFDAIIDYTQHLAMLKQGGLEFLNSVPLYEKFQRQAAQYNSKLKEMGFFSMQQLEYGPGQELRSPRFTSGAIA